MELRRQFVALAAVLFLSTNAAVQLLMKENESHIHKHSLQMDDSRKFIFYWSTAEHDDPNVYMTILVASHGWAGIGLSKKAMMTDADLVVMWADEMGEMHISDRHGVDNGCPPIDSLQDWERLAYMKNETHARFDFSRRRNTCDTDDMVMAMNATFVLWAYSTETPTSSNCASFRRHSARGSKAVNLFPPDNRMADMAAERQLAVDRLTNQPMVKRLPFRMNAVPLPTDTETLYWCRIFPLPVHPLGKRQYIIGYQMKVASETKGRVHHAMLYSCGDLNMSAYVGGNGEVCFDKDGLNFSPTLNCTAKDTIATWGTGGGPSILPNDSGYLLDPEAKYVLLEVHYDNYDKTPDLTDNSALELFVTEKRPSRLLRRLHLGAFVRPDSQIVPPGVSRFVTSSYCPQKCTNTWPPEIRVTGALLHAHAAARAMRIRHFRDGQELTPVFELNHYDFNHQNHIELQSAVEILRGDVLIVECEYDTRDRTKATLGNYASLDEMCLAFVDFFIPEKEEPILSKRFGRRFHLPKALRCWSGPKVNSTFELLGAKRLFDTSRPPLVQDWDGKNYSVRDWMDKSVQWNSRLSSAFQQFVRYGPQEAFCSAEVEDVRTGVSESTYGWIHLNALSPDTVPDRRRSTAADTVCADSVTNTLLNLG